MVHSPVTTRATLSPSITRQGHMTLSQNMEGNYALSHPIGRGAYGEVFQATDRRYGTKLAIKRVPNVYGDSKELKRLLREIKLMKHFRGSSHLVGSLDLFLDSRDCLHIVMELMEEDLHHRLQRERLSEELVKDFSFQLMCGIRDMHAAGVIHRDLRPKNLLVRGSELKITDFGMGRSRSLRMSLMDLTTTRWYRAPEGFTFTTEYTESVDMWAAGLIIVDMLGIKSFLKAKTDIEQLELIFSHFGTPSELQHASRSQQELFQKYLGRSTVPLESVLVGVDEMCIDLLHKVLNVEPKSRASASEALEHPYLRESIDRLGVQTSKVEPAPSEVNCEDMTPEEMRQALIVEVESYK